MKDKFLVIIFIAVLVFITITNLLTSDKAFSSRENRYLQQLPQPSYESIISGKYSKEFEKYTIGQFIMREKWIGLKTLSDKLILKKDNGRVYLGKDGYLFNIDDNLNQSQFTKNIEAINKFSNEIIELNNDIDINALLVPSKSEAVKHKLPIFAPVVDEIELYTNIKESLNKEINLISLFETLSHEHNLYYKTDHHWTTKGSLKAYQKYCNEIGIKPLVDKDFTIEVVSDDFLGTSYRKANFYLDKAEEIEKYILKNPVNLEVIYDRIKTSDDLYNEKFLSKTDKYSYFLGGDHSLVEINTDVKNNQSVLILKDSFANSMIPFLTSHYSNIYVVDMRYYNDNIINFIKVNEIEEVLMLYNVQTFVQEKTMLKLSK